jgi:large subunit ribosomal protein L31
MPHAPTSHVSSPARQTSQSVFQFGGDRNTRDSAFRKGPAPARSPGPKRKAHSPSVEPLTLGECTAWYNSSFIRELKELVVKEGIHPAYQEVEARCACGNTFKTRSTKSELHLEICSACHPFFTGRQKLIDTEGRVERFTKKFGVQTSEQRKIAERAAKAATPPATKAPKATATA